MIHEEFKIKTLELPWLKNAVNISCISEGDYIVYRDKYGRHQYYAIQNVVNRTFIEMHIATNVKDLLGCIGFSRDDIESLLKYVGDNSFTLTITHFNPVFMTAKTIG
jgi:hypothetical protein